MATWASMGLLGYGVKRAISGPPAANDLPPITSSSKEEENFIKEFLKLAEADDAKSKAH
ncbi:hypothetical protein IWQ62_003257 [Dispira parvispora]|uniref:ATP synthase subunit K, mitochondrial n=1 Tax=Dispira parvispora TaxID=1520584 RepID=A0A9W8ANS7_9FUNG|nr:hypothetical protein IWQ62_003257 [Dispira parvispora]